MINVYKVQLTLSNYQIARPGKWANITNWKDPPCMGQIPTISTGSFPVARVDKLPEAINHHF